MAQPEFSAPDFVDDNMPEDIQERMMGCLPDDIDDMPGGFPYDFTMPSAIEKSELINFHLVRALMVAFPQYAWDEWLDLHGKQVNVARHGATAARGFLQLEGEAGTKIAAGTIFSVPAVDDAPAVEYETVEDCVIQEGGVTAVEIAAVEAGTEGNVKAGAISIMDEPLDEITGITNPEAVTGGAEAESDDDYYDRIAAVYASSRTYLGNDADYKRWAQEAGAGDCIVDAASEGPGTVRLVLVDRDGRPADGALLEAVYNHIVSPGDRSLRLLPTACAKLVCTAAETVQVNYLCTGVKYNPGADPAQAARDFEDAVKGLYPAARRDGVLRYNDVRPVIGSIGGIEDFETFLMNGGTGNVLLESGEYPETGSCEFCQEGGADCG